MGKSVDKANPPNRAARSGRTCGLRNVGVKVNREQRKPSTDSYETVNPCKSMRTGSTNQSPIDSLQPLRTVQPVVDGRHRSTPHQEQDSLEVELYAKGGHFSRVVCECVEAGLVLIGTAFSTRSGFCSRHRKCEADGDAKEKGRKDGHVSCTGRLVSRFDSLVDHEWQREK